MSNVLCKIVIFKVSVLIKCMQKCIRLIKIISFKTWKLSKVCLPFRNKILQSAIYHFLWMSACQHIVHIRYEKPLPKGWIKHGQDKQILVCPPSASFLVYYKNILSISSFESFAEKWTWLSDYYFYLNCMQTPILSESLELPTCVNRLIQNESLT